MLRRRARVANDTKLRHLQVEFRGRGEIMRPPVRPRIAAVPALFEILAMGDARQVRWDEAAEGFGVGFEAQGSAASVGEPGSSELFVSGALAAGTNATRQR